MLPNEVEEKFETLYRSVGTTVCFCKRMGVQLSKCVEFTNGMVTGYPITQPWFLSGFFNDETVDP